MTPRGDEWKTRARWIVGGVIVAALAACGWLVLTDAPAYRFLVRLYVNKQFLKDTLREWGVLAPVIFMGLQVLQVVVAPIPGELTGILGGYLFGQWVGLLYSTIGLTLGSVAAFAVGRWLGSRYIQKLVSPDTWRKLGFIVEAEGAILCFVIFLIPRSVASLGRGSCQRKALTQRPATISSSYCSQPSSSRWRCRCTTTATAWWNGIEESGCARLPLWLETLSTAVEKLLTDRSDSEAADSIAEAD